MIRRRRQHDSAILALLTAVCCLAVAGCNSRPTLSPLEPDARVVAFGDSLTSGVGMRVEEAYPATLARLLGVKVINAGKPGELTAEGLERLPDVLHEHRPDLLILCHGGNDLLQRRSRETIAGNLEKMVLMARATGAEVVLIGVPGPSLTMAVPGLYPDLANKLELPYEGDVLREILSKRSLKQDPVHPNRPGHARLARAIADLIKASSGQD